MNKTAIKAKFVYYNNKIHEDTHLIVSGEYIQGIQKNPPEECRIIDRSSSGIFPGFINAHTHLPMSMFRGLADDLPLKEWLENHIWPVENKILSNEFVYDATLLAAAEMIRSGTICANDMYFYSEQIGGALTDLGLKGVVGAGVLDFPTKFAKSFEEYLTKAEILIDEFKDSSLINVALCPHAPYTVNPENYKKCVDFCVKNNILIHTHLSETKWEVDEINKRYGKSPVKVLDETGFFDINSISAHMVWVDDEEIEILGKKNANIISCIESNLKLANGFAPIFKMKNAGVNITIGTDGNASNNDLNMLSEISTFSKVHKGLTFDPTHLQSSEIIDIATKNAAKALNLKKCGEIKKGNFADFFIISFDDINMMPVYNPVSHLVFTGEPSNITDLYVNGKCLMENRKFTTIDLNYVKEKTRYWENKIKKVLK